MNRGHLTLLIGLALVAGLLLSVSLGVKNSQQDELDRVFMDERPSSFSLNIGDPKASVKGFFESLKAGLNVFGLVPKEAESADEAALKALVEETKKQIAAEAQKQSAQENEKAQRRKRLHSQLVDTDLEEDRYTKRESDRGKGETNSEAAFFGGSQTVAGAASPQHESYMDEGLPNDVEGWLARIVSQRSYRVFTQFVALYKVGTVSEDIFYSVVRELLADSDILLVKYGVLALTSAIETESFATLVEYRSLLPHDPEIYQLVSQGFQSYSEPANLPHLFPFLRNPEASEIFFEAVTIAENSIRDWFLQESNSSEGEERPIETAMVVYSQLSQVLSEGYRKAATEDTKGPLARLISMMGDGADELVAGVGVPN